MLSGILILSFILSIGALTDVSSFLLQNRLPQCYADPSEPRMPLSYYVPDDYFPNVPPDQRIPPNAPPKKEIYVDFCGKNVQPLALDAYEFQTETLLSAGGLNIYDGAVWQMAVALLKEVNDAVNVQSAIINSGATCEFPDIRGSAPCKGSVVMGECTDINGNCGFCYGRTGSIDERSLTKPSAWSFRMISDYWAFEGTVDQRCPEKNAPWTWNDYRPVLGENSWAFLLGPLQVAYFKYGNVYSIPSNDLSLTMAIGFLPSLMKMTTPNGGVSYAPMNTLNGGRDMGWDISTENNISLLAGLKMLRYILSQTGYHLDKLGDINTLINNVESYIKLSYDPSLGYFRQGGSYNPDGSFSWATGDYVFSVDCQTWAMSVVSPLLIDQWFGPGTSVKIWNTAKTLGGYGCYGTPLQCKGVGFTVNKEQVFSGEWTLGAINMLRVFANEYNDQSFAEEATNMRQAIEDELIDSVIIDGVPVTGVKYANKRYYIPFGWWANPLLSTASTGWAVLVDNDYNPFFWGGDYKINY